MSFWGDAGGMGELTALAGAGSGYLAYLVGSKKLKGGAAMAAAAGAGVSSLASGYFAFAMADDLKLRPLISIGVGVVVGVGSYLAGLLLGKANKADKSVQKLSLQMVPPDLAGRAIIGVAIGASLVLGGTDLFKTSTPGSFSGVYSISAVNTALQTATTKPSSAWNNDPTGTVFVQQDTTLTRIAYVTPDANKSNLDVQVITFTKAQAPTYINSLPPGQSYASLLNVSGSPNSAGVGAYQAQSLMLTGTQNALASGDAASALTLASNAAAAPHQAQ